MKKLVCIFLSILMMASMLSLVSCGGKETLRFGMGVYTAKASASDATEDKDGEGKVAITAAVITVDAAGKVVACQLDTADNSVKYTTEGKAVSKDEFKTKYEQGSGYGMVAHGNATGEWFEQADAFESVVAGKTLDEIKAMVATGDKGTEDVINAGCTIMIAEFVKAIEKAFANLEDSAATKASTLELGIYTVQSPKDATEEKEGQNQIETTVFAAAMEEGKVVVADTDCVQVKFTFDKSGASTFDTAKAISTKREQGANYGMVNYGNAAGEWFEQADAFLALCVGKTASEIAALCASDNYGTEDVKAAGCTILVNGFAKAAAKLG